MKVQSFAKIVCVSPQAFQPLLFPYTPLTACHTPLTSCRKGSCSSNRSYEGIAQLCFSYCIWQFVFLDTFTYIHQILPTRARKTYLSCCTGVFWSPGTQPCSLQTHPTLANQHLPWIRSSFVIRLGTSQRELTASCLSHHVELYWHLLTSA